MGMQRVALKVAKMVAMRVAKMALIWVDWTVAEKVVRKAEKMGRH